MGGSPEVCDFLRYVMDSGARTLVVSFFNTDADVQGESITFDFDDLTSIGEALSRIIF